jgi:hypothetical protein
MERESDYESRFLKPEQLKELDEVLSEFEQGGLVYAPNSVWHGSKNGGHHKDTTLLKIEIGRLHDFIDFLFEDREYCDHANESEAWDEFRQREYSQLTINVQEDKRSVASKVDSSNQVDKQK